MVKRKIWIFGQSHCLPYNLKNKKHGWDYIVGKKFKAKVINCAQEASDNFHIFYTFLERVKQIKKNDIVIIGWSHPCRKSFILDKNNIKQKKALTQSHLYKNKKIKFIRGKGSGNGDKISKWAFLKPKDSGTEYYDNWYENYFNLQEQRIYFLAFLQATKKILSDRNYYHFYFSKESVKSLGIPNDKLFILEFIRRNKVQISKLDAHCNEKGHKMLAQIIYKGIKKI